MSEDALVTALAGYVHEKRDIPVAQTQIRQLMNEPSLCHRRVPSSHKTMRSWPKMVRCLAWLAALMLLVAACGPTETERIDESLALVTTSPRPIEIALDPIARESPTALPSTPTDTPEPSMLSPTRVRPTPTETTEPPTPSPTRVRPTPTETTEPPTPSPTRVRPTPTETTEPPTPSPTRVAPAPTETTEVPALTPAVTIEVTAESPTEMSITWSHDLGGPVRQELYRDGELIATPAPDQSLYEDGDLSPNRRYEYRIVLWLGEESIAMDEAAAATLVHAPKIAGPFDAHRTGFSLAIVDDLNPPETTYKVTVWNAQWHLNAKHYSHWSTSRCRAFEDLPTGLPFKFEVVARNLDGVKTLPIRKTIDGKDLLSLPEGIADEGSTEVVDGEGEQQCQTLESLEFYDIGSMEVLLLLSGF